MRKADDTPSESAVWQERISVQGRFMFYLLSGEVRHVDKSVVKRGKDVCHAKQQLAFANLKAEKKEEKKKRRENCVSMRQMRFFRLFLSLKFP